MHAQEVAAIWVAIVSTASMVVLFREKLFDRPRAAATALFRSDPEIGHEILISNRCAKAVTIYAYDLVWAEGRLWPDVKGIEYDLADRFVEVRIEAGSTARVRFNQSDYFSSQPPGRFPNAKLYIRLWFANRSKPQWLRLG